MNILQEKRESVGNPKTIRGRLGSYVDISTAVIRSYPLQNGLGIRSPRTHDKRARVQDSLKISPKNSKIEYDNCSEVYTDCGIGKSNDDYQSRGRVLTHRGNFHTKISEGINFKEINRNFIQNFDTISSRKNCSGNKILKEKAKIFSHSKNRGYREKNAIEFYRSEAREYMNTVRKSKERRSINSERKAIRCKKKLREASTSINRISSGFKINDQSAKKCGREVENLKDELDDVKRIASKIEAKIREDKRGFNRTGEKMRKVKQELENACRWINEMKNTSSKRKYRRKDVSKKSSWFNLRLIEKNGQQYDSQDTGRTGQNPKLESLCYDSRSHKERCAVLTQRGRDSGFRSRSKENINGDETIRKGRRIIFHSGIKTPSNQERGKPYQQGYIKGGSRSPRALLSPVKLDNNEKSEYIKCFTYSNNSKPKGNQKHNPIFCEQK